MDAFAVSIAIGLDSTKNKTKIAWIAGLFFGIFQAIMPLLSIFLCKTFEVCIIYMKQWKLASILLGLVALKMFYEYFFSKDEIEVKAISLKYFFVLAVATSIDAFFVGPSILSLNLSSNFPIILAVFIIGIITFIFSFCGVIFGNKLGCYFEKKAELLGAVVLLTMAIFQSKY